MTKKPAIIIPNWNGKDYLSKCLASIEAQSLRAEVIVVDNGSSDGSADLIKDKFPNVKLLEFEDNAGFAGGVNRGIRYALENKHQCIALFNNDAVADKNWLKNLIKALDDNPKAGIVTGKLMQSDKIHIDSTGDFYTVWGLPFPRGRNHKDEGQYDKTEEVFGASGGASLYRADLFRQIGLFDEDFFAYYEDVDISFRAQMAGWKVIYTPKAIAYHAVGGTSSKMGDFTRFHSIKNFLLLYTRNMPTKLLIKYLPLFCLQYGRLVLGAINNRKVIVFIKGTWAAVRLHKQTIEVRKGNLSRQKASSNQINQLLIKSRPPKVPTIN